MIGSQRMAVFQMGHIYELAKIEGALEREKKFELLRLGILKEY